MNALTRTENTALQPQDNRPVDLGPRTFEQALQFSQYLAESDLVPKDFKGRPGNCLIAIQWGAELGLKPLQAMQNLAIINGRPSLWGDAVIALVRGSSLCEYVLESDDGQTATCKVKRRGEPEQVRTFSMADATAAGLSGKSGPWAQYPKRMRQMRARAFALRDVFPDVLRGLPVAEEIMDTPPEKHMGPAEVVSAPAAPSGAYPEDEFITNLPQWTKIMAGGKVNAEGVINKVNSVPANKHQQLSDDQKARIRAAQPGAAPAATPAADAPAMTEADVQRQMDEAKDIDTLNEAAALIDAIPDAAARERLGTHFDVRNAELS